ncbi:hypothetical protein NG99_26110, partial [Erwinia typographi]
AADGTTTTDHTVTVAEAGKALSLVVKETLADDADGAAVTVWYTVARSAGGEGCSLVATYNVISGSNSMNIDLDLYTPQFTHETEVYLDFVKEIPVDNVIVKDTEAMKCLKSDLYVIDFFGEKHSVTIGGSFNITTDLVLLDFLKGTVENTCTSEIDTHLIIYAFYSDGELYGHQVYLELKGK